MRKFIVSTFTALAITFISSVSIAGRVEGPAEITDSISPERFNNHAANLKGGEVTVITLKGDGGSDLDCFLLNSLNEIVTSDVNSSDTCTLTITPTITGRYDLRVYNAGSKRNTYVSNIN